MINNDIHAHLKINYFLYYNTVRYEGVRKKDQSSHHWSGTLRTHRSKITTQKIAKPRSYCVGSQ